VCNRARNELSTPDTLHIEIIEKNEARKSEAHSNSTKAMFANKYKGQKHSSQHNAKIVHE